jgi:IS30 family transposase
MYWSPQQIAGRIRADFPNDKDMRISHETIYAYIYAMPKGRLLQEIIANLRRKHPYRQKQGRGASGQGRICAKIFSSMFLNNQKIKAQNVQ